MQTFLEEIIGQVYEKHKTLENLVFVLPSKRAGTFLRRAIAKASRKTIFLPDIYSIEDFVEHISGLTSANTTHLLFELYTAYLKCDSGDKENFYSFSKWGQTLLQDFNEIDRYLIDPKAIFGNLTAVQEMNHWSVKPDKTEMIENYLRFWNHIEEIYTLFNVSLIEKGLGHQGLIYRHACKHLQDYQEKQKKIHIFLGFNALNTAESNIIERMLLTSNAEIYWDIDSYFLADPIHDAGYFIRKYHKQWPYFKQNDIQGVASNYEQAKNIKIIGVPKNIAQAKYVGVLLKELKAAKPDLFSDTALVLGNENLLDPILNSLAPEVSSVNITMGYPLQNSLLAQLFQQFFELHTTTSNNGWYHRNILNFLSHPYVTTLLEHSGVNYADLISTAIKTQNLTLIKVETLHDLTQNDHAVISLLFFKETITTKEFVKLCLELIEKLRDKFLALKNTYALEYLYRFHQLFNQILDLVNSYAYITDLKSLLSLYKELLQSETLDFKGDPLEGLQIMGMLESRNLDFENVIITSVNEGILPSGKSNNSFIPFDLKTHFKLPTYKEKDAVYTYHFYRLLQRSKNVYLLYNTEPDVLEGGEKSRLIAQLLTDDVRSNDTIEIIAAPKIVPVHKILDQIKKDDHVIELIKTHAASGFSPSSLSNYIRNPIDFYKQSLLGIEDSLEVEETIASNTLGTVVHNTLEDLFHPFIGEILTVTKLTEQKNHIEQLVKHHFAQSYLGNSIAKGKNLIAYHVVLRYLENFIDSEIEVVKTHKIKILGLEQKLKIQLQIPEVGFPIYLKGTLDRIDEKDGLLRIIDYKTGKVEQKNVTVSDWDNIISDYDYSKAFQLLCYAAMYHDKDMSQIMEMEAGIITFKNLGSGLLKFNLKNIDGNKGADHLIDANTVAQFHAQLKKLVLEICDINFPFNEKEV
ncbi:MAG: PD-(D/E)XK nuclease family protein [Flavobacteriaceae bacterium]